MTNATDNWFRKLNEERYDMLTEAKVEDFNLPDIIVGKVRAYLHGTSEKGRIWAAEQWKEQPMPATEAWKNKFVNPTIEEIDKLLDGPPGHEKLGGDKWEEFKDDIRKVAFISDNLDKALTSQTEGAQGRLKKSINKAEKALKRNPYIKSIFTSDEEMNERLGDIFGRMKDFAYNTMWTGFYENSRNIFTYLNDDPSNYEYFKGKDVWDPVEITYYDRTTRKKETADFQDLDTYAEYLLQNIEDEQMIIHTFEDGSYWYDLDTRRCSVEGQRMGHCGAADEGTMWSLRYMPKGRKWSSSLVTIEYDQDTETVHQIKGRDNNAPHKGTWPHIVWFIDEMDVEYIAERGQHSDDHEGFEKLREYLEENTNATFRDSTEEQAEQLEEDLREIERSVNGRLDHGGVDGADSVDYDGDHIYYYATAGMTYVIPLLGWEGFQRGPENKSYVARGENAVGFRPMPYDDDFYNWKDIIPNYPEEIEWDLDDTGGAVELRVDVTWRCEDCSDASDFQYFADDFETSVDNYYDDTVNQITKLLARKGIINPSGWTTTARELSDLDQQLQNWQTDLDLDDLSDTIRFWLHEGDNDEVIESGVSIPSEYITRSGIRAQDVNQMIRQVFGGTHYGGIEVRASSLFMDSVFNALKEMDREANLAAQQQTRLPGIPAEYFRNMVQPIKLSDDMEVFLSGFRQKETLSTSNRFAPIELSYRIVIEMDEDVSKENLEAAMNFMKQMDSDNNVEKVKTAINQVIQARLQNSVQQQNKTYKEIEDGTVAKKYIGQIVDTYSGQTHPSAQSRVEFARWAAENIKDMNSVEIYVLTQLYLKDVAGGGWIDFNAQEDRFPPSWVPRVRTELEKRGHPEPRSYQAGVRESIEDQIIRIDRQLAERKTDLRIYRVYVTAVVYPEIATDKEIQDQIRGIRGVTTVDPMAVTRKKLTPTSYRIKLAIKFELLGQLNRDAYIQKRLLPHMRKIKALGTVSHQPNVELVSGGDPTDITETKIMKEYYGDGSIGGFGGMGANLGALRHPTGQMVTPRPALQTIIDDWAQGGVQLYDSPVNTHDMRYTVMMPVEELWSLAATHYRGAAMDFDGRYRHFIKDGPTNPVYLAIGKNGRAKITGNEDVVWFAKKSGLEEVPVFLSYQRQV